MKHTDIVKFNPNNSRLQFFIVLRESNFIILDLWPVLTWGLSLPSRTQRSTPSGPVHGCDPPPLCRSHRGSQYQRTPWTQSHSICQTKEIQCNRKASLHWNNAVGNCFSLDLWIDINHIIYINFIYILKYLWTTGFSFRTTNVQTLHDYRSYQLMFQ